MMAKKWQRWGRSWQWLLLLLAVSWPTLVTAHGSGTPRLVNVLAGPYRLWVWSLPDPIRVGETHISVAIEEATPAEQSNSSTDYTVNIIIHALDQSDQQFALTTSKQDRFLQTYYEVDFAMPTVGEWEARVNLSGAAGAGTAAFPFTVLPPQRVNWELVIWIGIMVVAMLWAIGQYRSPGKPQASSTKA